MDVHFIPIEISIVRRSCSEVKSEGGIGKNFDFMAHE
jgi:hypothetical protein